MTSTTGDFPGEPCVIVTPFYHWPLWHHEEVSLHVLRTVLSAWPKIFVAPEGFDFPAGFLKPSESIKFMPAWYFSDIAGYNRLMLSTEFFLAFCRYRFILIYQLDCLVFRDELSNWVNRGYAYIGAPWPSPTNATELGLVGNGGFSLRNVSVALEVLQQRIPRGSFFRVPPPESRQPGGWSWFIFNLRRKIREWFGRWDVSDELDNYFDNEDKFWSVQAPQILSHYQKPSPPEAAEFSLELNASAYFHNTGKLPFGCHAWNKYEPDFWLDKLESSGLLSGFSKRGGVIRSEPKGISRPK